MFLRNERGSALFIVVMITLVTFVLGSALLSLAVTENQISRNQTDEVKALNIAEAGIDMAINELRKNPAWVPNSSVQVSLNGQVQSLPIDIGEGQLSTLTVNTDIGDPSILVLTSTGAIKRGASVIKKTLEVKVSIVDPFESQPRQGISFSSGGMEKINLGNVGKHSRPVINGNISSVDHIRLDDNLTLLGNLYAKGDVDIDSSITLGSSERYIDIYSSGKIRIDSDDPENSVEYAHFHPNVTVEVPPFPPEQQEWFYNARSSLLEGAHAKSTIELTLTAEKPIDKEIIFVYGDLDLKGTYQGKGTIVVTGNVFISGDLVRNSAGTSDSLFIVSYGDIENSKPSDEAIIEAVFLCYKDMTVADKTKLSGAIMTNRLNLEGSSVITFNRDLVKTPPAGSPIKIISWLEKID